MSPSLDFAACLATGWHLTPDFWLRLVVLAGLLMVAGWAGAQRYFPGQRAFLLLHAAMWLWLLLTLAERAAGAPPCKLTLALLAWPAILAIPMLWAVFLHRYVHSDHRPLPGARVLLLALPVLLFGAVSLANGQHGLLYGPGTAPGALSYGVVRMNFQRGPLFWLQAAYAYGLLLYCSLLVLRALRGATGAENRQWLGFLAMTLVPWASNGAYLAFGLRIYGSDPTPMSFGVAVAGMAWLMHRRSLFEVVPMARRLLFTELVDPVLVLDAGNRVMDANEAALALARSAGAKDVAPPRGTPLAQWPGIGDAVAERLGAGAGDGLLKLAAPGVIFEMRVRDIGQGARQIGRLVQLRDVTAQQQAQARVVQALAESRARLDRVASLQQELREQTLRDPLTGLYNRRALAERFEHERAHHRATAQPLALAVLDVDHFKQVNDALGHAAGDRLLVSLASVMRESLRSSDTVCRTGGEEFALLLPNADADTARRRVEALLRRVADTDHGLDGRRVTLSAGVAALEPGLDTLDALLQKADRALYRAKSGGRDRSEMATLPMPLDEPPPS